MENDKYCENCGTDLDYFNVIMLEGSHNYLCLNCYNKISLHYYKGILTFEEVQLYKELNVTYKQSVTNYLFKLKKLIVYNQVNAFKSLYNFIEYENILSLEMFNKNRSCLSIAEHIIILNKVLSNIVKYDRLFINGQDYYNVKDDKEVKITEIFNDDLLRLSKLYLSNNKLESWKGLDLTNL